MNAITTITASAATLTEKELWALFVTHTMKSTFSMGPTVELYRPDDLVRDPGTYGGVAQYSADVADGIEQVDEPLGELAMRIEETAEYLANLKRVHDDFARLKESLRIVDEDDEDGEEQSVRFRHPLIGGEAA